MGIGTDIMSETPRELRAEDYDFLLPYFLGGQGEKEMGSIGAF